MAAECVSRGADLEVQRKGEADGDGGEGVEASKRETW